MVERTGWTLEYIDQMNWEDFWRLVVIYDAVGRAREHVSRRQQRQSAAARKGRGRGA